MSKIINYMNYKYGIREDKDNIFPVGISDAEFRKFAIDYLLGEDWYVVDPLGQDQVNEIALFEILEKFSKRFKREKARFINERVKHDAGDPGGDRYIY